MEPGSRLTLVEMATEIIVAPDRTRRIAQLEAELTRRCPQRRFEVQDTFFSVLQALETLQEQERRQ